MQFHRVGLPAAVLILLLSLTGVVRAQEYGQILSIGFSNTYRNDAWTPMIVQVRSSQLKSGLYQLQVIQEDLDRDKAVYTRFVSVDSSQPDQKFEMYFLPRPIDGGLPSGLGLIDWQRTLSVRLADDRNREIAILPMTTTAQNVEAANNDPRRGVRFVLAVGDESTLVQFGEYASAVGTMEDAVLVKVRPTELPENQVGYEGIDAVVWFSGDASTLDEVGARRGAALEQYVRTGGRLIVCQPARRERIQAIADLLPVESIDPAIPGAWRMQMRERDKLEPLRQLANPRGLTRANDPWDIPQPPFRVAHTKPKPGARVDLWIMWEDGPSPYLVRWTRGLGTVTWVAQDLGDPAITARTNVGWTHVWDTVIGWNNEPHANLRGSADATKVNYGFTDAVVDVGQSLDDLMNHGGRGAALLLVAAVFFIVYWVVAGPGGYVWLATKGRAHHSWVVFGASALGATLITVLLVKLLLRGDPAIKHLSILRWTPGAPALALSNVGLYIPNDGYMELRLPQHAPGSAAYVTPYPIHPAYLRRDEQSPPAQDYRVPVPDVAGEADPYSLAIPYRSTLKKLHGRWVGDLPLRIDGKVQLTPGGVAGVLTNSCGVDLQDAYLAYRGPDNVIAMYYIPKWPQGAKIDLADPAYRRFVNFQAADGLPGANRALFGRFGRAGGPLEWDTWLLGVLRDRTPDMLDRQFLPLLTFFELLPPMREQQQPVYINRKEVLRRSGRAFDMSHVVVAGSMVILATGPADTPVPMTLQVEGDDVPGEGTTVYQLVLPIDRSIEVAPSPPPPATQPTTKNN